MRRAPRVEKICTVCNEIGDIGDSMKGSSSPMKNKVGAQKGALIKMKQENMYTYQWLYRLCYVPIIAPPFLVKSSSYYCSVLLFLTRMCIFARCGCDKIEATDDQYICFNELNNATWEFCKTCNRRSSPFCERRF